jgi:hypothetical protein
LYVFLCTLKKVPPPSPPLKFTWYAIEHLRLSIERLRSSAMLSPATVLFLFNSTFISGGPAAMHHACFTLGGQDPPLARSRMLQRNVEYSIQYESQSTSSLVCESVLPSAAVPVLNSRDVIVVPEGWLDGGIGVTPSTMSKLRSDGARAVTYVLSMARYETGDPLALGDLTIGGFVPLPHSAYTQDFFGIPWEVLYSPVEPIVYAMAEEYEADPMRTQSDDYETIRRFAALENPILFDDGKAAETLVTGSMKPLILIDDDARIPVSISDPQLYHFEAVANRTKPEVYALLRRAVIIIDLWVNGLERIACEGILFDTFPIVARQDNGNARAQSDFSHLPVYARVDIGADLMQLSNAVAYIAHRSLVDMEGLRSDYRPFKDFVLGLRVASAAASGRIFASRALQIVMVCAGRGDGSGFGAILATQIRAERGEVPPPHAMEQGLRFALNHANSPAALLGALSIFQHRPLASVEIVVKSQVGSHNASLDVGLQRYLRQHAPLIEILERLGLTDQKGGTPGHSLRIRGDGFGSEQQNAKPFLPRVIHGDVLVFVEEPVMIKRGHMDSMPRSMRVARVQQDHGDGAYELRMRGDRNEMTSECTEGEKGSSYCKEIEEEAALIRGLVAVADDTKALCALSEWIPMRFLRPFHCF